MLPFLCSTNLERLLYCCLSLLTPTCGLGRDQTGTGTRSFTWSLTGFPPMNHLIINYVTWGQTTHAGTWWPDLCATLTDCSNSSDHWGLRYPFTLLHLSHLNSFTWDGAEKLSIKYVSKQKHASFDWHKECQQFKTCIRASTESSDDTRQNSLQQVQR